MPDWRRALKIEVEVARIIHRQEMSGVQFDLDKAISHVEYLTNEMDRLYGEVRPYLDYDIDHKYQPVLEPFKLNGELKANPTNWFGDDAYLISGPFCKVAFLEPDLGSRNKLIDQLIKFGWKPTIFTPKTDKGGGNTPKLTDKGKPVDSLMEIEAPVGKQLAAWFILRHRRSQIAGWINRIRPDGRLSAGANSCGTNTCRMRHRNVVNVPKADPSVVFGYEMRDLFIARPGYRLVGHDASGLEARVMGHYTYPYDDGEFARELMEGDVHSKNTRVFYPKETEGLSRGDPTFEAYRSKSKNGYYALIYGAQPPRLAETLGVSLKVARRLFDLFWKANPALGQLRERVISISNSQGWVPGLDGRKVFTRSEHSALNTVFQSAGAIAMKASIVILNMEVKRRGLDVVKVIDMHDEAQAEENAKEIITLRGDTGGELIAKLDDQYSEVDESVRPIWTKPHQVGDHWECYYSPYGEQAVLSIRRAGEYFDFRVPLDGEYKVGNSWAETH